MFGFPRILGVGMPEYLKHRVNVSFVTSIEEVLAIALTKE